MAKTTKSRICILTVMLWFAQNSLPLRWQRQRQLLVNLGKDRCDLLKIHYLCGGKDNSARLLNNQAAVVICSKFITFAVAKTTKTPIPSEPISCDLLKIHYLCGGKDNVPDSLPCITNVVICSKFITFAVAKTTDATGLSKATMLWFAQNSLPLRWQRQRLVHTFY